MISVTLIVSLKLISPNGIFGKQFNSPNNDYDDLLIIQDTNGDKYYVTNLFFKLDFNKEEDYKNFEIGKTYKVKGYGVKNLLSQNLNIYEIIEKID